MYVIERAIESNGGLLPPGPALYASLPDHLGDTTSIESSAAGTEWDQRSGHAPLWIETFSASDN
jgi:hypothetical protein